MKILAIDTSGPLLSLALQREADIFEITLNLGRGDTERLAPALDELFRAANLAPSELSLISAARGPGSFTGLRIGLACAKALSFALNKPLASVSSLEAIAGGAAAGLPVLAVLDARKNRFYIALYHKGQAKSGELDATPEEARLLCQKHQQVLLSGPGAASLQGLLNEEKFILNPCYMAGIARFMLPLAVRQLEMFGADSSAQGPNYVRLSDAELELKAKER